MSTGLVTVEDGPLLVTEPVENILEVTLNRPERTNALTPGLLDRFGSVLDAVAADTRLRAVVLTGSGHGFCSGFDLEELKTTWSMGIPELLAHQERWAAAVQRVVDLPLPVIAAVDGPAVGAGMSLASAADLRVGTSNASFGAAFVRVGLSGADLGLSWTLPRIVGMGVAAEIMLTGTPIDGTEAFRLGLINRLCADAELRSSTFALAGEVARNSPFGVRLTKRTLHAGVDAPSFAAAAEIENRNQVLASRTDDMPMALQALRDGGTPEFGNR